MICCSSFLGYLIIIKSVCLVFLVYSKWWWYHRNSHSTCSSWLWKFTLEEMGNFFVGINFCFCRCCISEFKKCSSHLLDNRNSLCMCTWNFQVSSWGFGPMTSAMLMQCSNQLGYGVTQTWAGQFVGLMCSAWREWSRGLGFESHWRHLKFLRCTYGTITKTAQQVWGSFLKFISQPQNQENNVYWLVLVILWLW